MSKEVLGGVVLAIGVLMWLIPKLGIVPSSLTSVWGYISGLVGKGGSSALSTSTLSTDASHPVSGRAFYYEELLNRLTTDGCDDAVAKLQEVFPLLPKVTSTGSTSKEHPLDVK